MAVEQPPKFPHNDANFSRDLAHFYGVQGLVGLVTGGGTGIGQASVLILAKAGAKKLFITGRRLGPLEETAARVKEIRPSCEVEAIECDLSQSASVAALVLKIKKYGQLDILVNNAGQFQGASLGATTDALWEETLRVNLQAPMGLTRDLLPLLKRSDAPSVVNISSTLAVKPIPEAAAYNASKAALVQLTRSLALELAPDGIRVNTILPAVVETPMYRGRYDNETTYQEGVRQANRLHPLGRMGQPEDIGMSVLFLASRASSWITGVALPVDGGMLVT
jgi:meso-butanediol dehydrogenase/(S,S)-butanediol dehydrogenase/diacetyl reductase